MWIRLSTVIKILLAAAAVTAMMIFHARELRCEEVRREHCNGRDYVSVESYNSCVRDLNRGIRLVRDCHRQCAAELEEAKAGILAAHAEVRAAKTSGLIDGFLLGLPSGAALVVLIVLLL